GLSPTGGFAANALGVVSRRVREDSAGGVARPAYEGDRRRVGLGVTQGAVVRIAPHDGALDVRHRGTSAAWSSGAQRVVRSLSPVVPRMGSGNPVRIRG